MYIYICMYAGSHRCRCYFNAVALVPFISHQKLQRFWERGEFILETHCLFPFWVSVPSAFPLPPPWDPWHCPGPSYLARGRATEKGRVYFLFLWIIYQYNSPLCCLATAEWRVSFIIRTERGCGKRDLNSSGSVWTLLSGESLNGGVFQQGYE